MPFGLKKCPSCKQRLSPSALREGVCLGCGLEFSRMADDVIMDELEKQEMQGRRATRRLFLEAALIAFANCFLAPLIATVLLNPYAILWMMVPRVALGVMLASYGPAWVVLVLGNHFGWSPGITRLGALVIATAVVCFLVWMTVGHYMRFGDAPPCPPVYANSCEALATMSRAVSHDVTCGEKFWRWHGPFCRWPAQELS